MALSDVQLRALKPTDKPYKIGDSGGLHVLVNPGGSKLWRLAYRHHGKQKLLALGTYPAVSLRDARKSRDEARELLESAQTLRTPARWRSAGSVSPPATRSAWSPTSGSTARSPAG